MSVVLLVSDDERVVRRMKSMLEDMAFEVMVAAKEGDVSRFCVAAQPSIVLSDIETPGGTGFESISIVRRLAKQAYIIAFSRGEHHELWPKVALACGANDFVPGPMSILSLIDAIDACNDVMSSAPSMLDGETLN